MRLLLSGSSGFIGSALLSFFQRKKNEVFSLSKTPSFNSLEGADAVIHLSGEPILGRWTKEKKEKILSSRVLSTSCLAKQLASLPQLPKVFICASAIGYYGDRGEELLTEESSKGSGFLSDVCSLWEEASQVLEEKGCRVIRARFGVVVGPGGALAKMVPLYKYCLGTQFGSGKQWISWIDREDLIRAIDFCLTEPSIRGSVNFVSPHPVRQKEWASILANLVHRPLWMKIPAPLIRLAFGQMGQEMFLHSARAVPAELLKAGFSFKYPDLGLALQKALRSLS